MAADPGRRVPDYAGTDRCPGVERRAPVPGRAVRHRDAVPASRVRGVRPHRAANVDQFLARPGLRRDLDPAIVAEFAHTVYRFGHSMLTETVDRFDPNFNVVADSTRLQRPTQQLGLIAAFLNPLAFAASGPTPEQAAGAIVRGLTRTVGNEIDEFVTEALRNNLLGLPLDLAVLNIARGRDAGIPPLNAARREFYKQTGDSKVKPYTSWADFVQHLKHPESLINFVAAYGTHRHHAADTLAGKRARVSDVIVLGGDRRAADRLDFLNSTGAWATTLGELGVTTTGLEQHRLLGRRPGRGADAVRRPARLHLQLRVREPAREAAGRRPLLLPGAHAGLNFRTELEDNSFAELIMANTDATHLPASSSRRRPHLEVGPDAAVHRAGRRRPRRPDRRRHDQRPNWRRS